MINFDLPIPDTVRCDTGGVPLTISCPVCRSPYLTTLVKQKGWVDECAHVLIVCDGCVDLFCGMWSKAILEEFNQRS